jgi:hypothetical protein
MVQSTNGPTFRIGINMAGAISAGAYTAGVLDFLIQALDEWEAAKSRSEPVPRHKVSIDVLSGASAGGMSAAIAIVALHEQFPPIVESACEVKKSQNKLYRSWVRDIDIEALLGTQDLRDGKEVVSLLDSTPIPEIAGDVIGQRNFTRRRSYVSNNLELFIALTNLRGVPYSVNSSNEGSFEEHIAYFADQIQFEIVGKEGDSPQSELAKPLPLSGGDSQWQLLRRAAVATGAFPIALAPGVLDRDRLDYDHRWWTVRSDEPKKDEPKMTGLGDQPNPEDYSCRCEEEKQIPPAWGSGAADTVTTVNVDGGATNNDPFEIARKYLASLPPRHGSHNPRNPLLAEKAVITIAPLPSEKTFDPQYNAANEEQLFPVVGHWLRLSFPSQDFKESLSSSSSPKIGLAGSLWPRPIPRLGTSLH